MDNDTRSQDSRDEDGFNDSVSMKGLREGEAPEPIVGTETTCVFCLEKCTNTNPKLLTCLMSSCLCSMFRTEDPRVHEGQLGE